MTTGAMIRLALQALVFIAWAFMMVRTLGLFRARDAERNDGFIAQAKYWLKSDEDRTDRKTLLFLTFVLIAMNLTNVVASL